MFAVTPSDPIYPRQLVHDVVPLTEMQAAEISLVRLKEMEVEVLRSHFSCGLIYTTST